MYQTVFLHVVLEVMYVLDNVGDKTACYTV